MNLDYIDPQITEEQDRKISKVSGFVAGEVYNELCNMIGGRWPDCKIQEEAPKAHVFFMRLFGIQEGEE